MTSRQPLSCYRVPVVIEGNHRNWIISASSVEEAKHRAQALAQDMPIFEWEVGDPVFWHKSSLTVHRMDAKVPPSYIRITVMPS